MSSSELPLDNEQDAAWVTIQTGVEDKWVERLLADPELFLRINPLMKYSAWKELEEGRIAVKGENQGNGHPFEMELVIHKNRHGFVVNYSEGLKGFTSIEYDPQTKELKITDDYSGCSEEERGKRIDEVDHSLTAWGSALKEYLEVEQRWHWFPIYNLYMGCFWRRMTPSARRISKMLVWITALEFFAFLMIFAIFWLELDHLFEL